MTLNHEHRERFLALMPHLGPDCDLSGVLGFARGREEECLSELSSDPGSDQVRAGMLRLLPLLVEGEEERRRWVGAANRVLDAFPEQAKAQGAPLLLSRHPAWVGLCAIEVSAFDGVVGANALARAVDLASSGFKVLGRHDVGEGEVLWAMAEQAEDVGWTARSRALLATAAAADFAEEVNRQQVRFLSALRRLDIGSDAEGDLLAVAEHEDAPSRTQVHAFWVLAQLATERRDIARARQHLVAAQQRVNREGDPQIALKIERALAALGVDP